LAASTPTSAGRNPAIWVFWALAGYWALQAVVALQSVLMAFAAACFFAAILEAPVRALGRRGLRRSVAVALLAVAFVLGSIALVWAFAKPIADQVKVVAHDAPRYGSALEAKAQQVSEAVPWLRAQVEGIEIGKAVSAAGKQALPTVGRASASVLTSLVLLFLTAVVTLYIAAAPRGLVRGLVRLTPPDRRRLALRIVSGIVRQIEVWAKATLWLMVLIGVVCGVGLWAMGVRSPLLFGILAGIGEGIPTVGPILSAVPPILVTLVDDPGKAAWVGLLYLVVQQVEQQVFVPRIMSSALRLHPASVLFFVAVMGALMGPVGLLFATPLCASVKVVYDELRRDAARRRPAGAAGTEA
jgi:predicted PurR-regulated permease PerM